MHVKVTEMVGESSDSWKGAVQAVIDEASCHGKNVVGVEVVNFTAKVQGGRLIEYKADVKIAHKD